MNKSRFIFLLPFFLICLSDISLAQIDTISIQDTLSTAPIDTTSSDTLQTERKSDIDAVVYSSSSDSMIFKVANKKLEIYGEGEIKYKQSELKSANIFVDFNTNQIEAVGEADTSDITGKKQIGTPVLSEAGEVYEGNKILYNFKTQRGFISLAKTETEGSLYGGEKVKKVDKTTYFIEDGIYTTCTDDPEDFYFYAKEMKVILKEQVVAKWIWFHIGGVPLPIPLPFGAFPNETGRRSGIIAPAFGERAGYGSYFSHIGYFWAISDYMDVNLTADYYTRGGYALDSRFRYNKRYSYSGNISAGFTNLHKGERIDPDYSEQKQWEINLYHDQTINPTTKVNANLTFVSGKEYYNNTSNNYDKLLNQNIVSNATFSKTWDESGNSMSLNYYRSQNLQTGDITENLPNLSFNMSQFYPFRGEGRVNLSNQKWYEMIGFNYNSQFLNRRIKSGGNLNIRGGIQHNVSTSASPKVGYFSVSPRITYTERWYNKRIRKEVLADTSGQDSVVDRDVKEINLVRNFSTGVSASTKLYGIIQPNTLGIEAFRHTISPSISYSYTPDFSTPKWGYYDSYVTSEGKVVKYSKFEDEVFQGPGTGEQQNIGLSVGNLFEMKTIKDPTDTTSEAKKIQLLNLNASLSYNFVADSLNFSPLNLSYRTQIGEYLTFNGSSSYSFYDFVGTTPINKTLLSQGKGLMRLTNFSFSLSTSISGEKLKGSKESQPIQQEESYPSQFPGNEYSNIYQDLPPDFTIPWDISLNYNYTYSKPFANAGENSALTFNANLNLTKTWKISLNGGYNFIDKELTAPQVRLYKDLHCWEMNLTWRPIGAYRGYNFEIKIKAPQLQDIKITRARGQGIFGR